MIRLRPFVLMLGACAIASVSAKAPAASPKSAIRATKPAVTAVEVRADSAPDVVTYGRRDDAQVLAREIAQREQLDPEWTLSQLAQARYQPAVARLVMPAPAGSAKNWAAYRARFVDTRRIREGVEFWRIHQRWLDRAQDRWGVPQEMVVAIIGVETMYGQVRGGFRVLDALTTLSLDFPKGRSDRSAFYRDQLGDFLAWCQQEQRDPAAVVGSYAGAIGLPQFMPSSIREYAVDFDEDGRIDLDQGGADVIGSVAHYFARFGWQRDQPTHFSVAAPTDTRARAALLAPDITPTFTPAQLSDAGAVLEPAARGYAGKLALVELQNGEQAPSYIAGTQNFYVVTRYNWSAYYAMAVIELAQALRMRFGDGRAATLAHSPLQ